MSFVNGYYSRCVGHRQLNETTRRKEASSGYLFRKSAVLAPRSASIAADAIASTERRAAKGEYAQMRYEHVRPAERTRPAGHRRKSSKRLRPREDWTVYPVPPVVSPEVWERVQRRLEVNRSYSKTQD